MNNRINRLHERTRRFVYNDTNLTFQELVGLDNSFTIHHRNLQRLATEMYKGKDNLSPTFMNNIFPGSNNPYNMRTQQTISYRGPKTWALLPNLMKESVSLSVFKIKIKDWKPVGCSCIICKEYIHGIPTIHRRQFTDNNFPQTIHRRQVTADNSPTTSHRR